MHDTHQPCKPRRGTLTLCVALSLALHLGLAFVLPLPQPGQGEKRGRGAQAPAPRRHAQLLFKTPAEEAAPPERPFAKTSADERQRQPEQAEFEGRHASRASGMDDAPERRNSDPLPTLDGERERDEIVTFDQQRQDGDLAHEGRRQQEPQPPAPPTPPATPPGPPTPPVPPASLAQGNPEGQPQPHDAGQRAATHASEGTASTNPAPPRAEGELKLREATPAPQPAEPRPPALAQGSPEGSEATPPAPRPQAPRRPLYDPSLAPEAQQPGFRTEERRTRSTGRFVFGRKPALNVAATARGAYEAEIYRRIARAWYAACDEHRGDIIPGSITVSLRLSRSGRIANMQLINRRGASLIQQSFSFGAIRRAALPPMPRDVQRDIVGELYEMILTFNFD